MGGERGNSSKEPFGLKEVVGEKLELCERYVSRVEAKNCKGGLSKNGERYYSFNNFFTSVP